MKRMSDTDFNNHVNAILSNPDTTEEDKQELYFLVKKRQEHKKYNALEYFEPHEWQKEFYKASKNHRYRFLSACNRVGKSLSMSYESAYALTGKYPDWWEGKRFNKPIKMWAVGNTTSQVTDILQALLIGTNTVKGNLSENPNFGTGAIPRDDLVVSSAQKDGARLESISVRHYNKYGEYDGDSEIAFKACSQGQEAFAGATLDLVWEDETPPESPSVSSLTLYTELLQRVRTTKGLVVITATPDFGETPLVKKFIHSESPQEYMLTVSMYDSPLYTDEDIEQAKLEIPEYLHPAKIYGKPEVTSGAVFPYNIDAMVIDPIPIPGDWIHVCALDVGWSDPTVCTWVAMSPNKVFHVYDTYAKAEDVPAVHAQAIKSRGADIPLILPHDAQKSSNTSGETAYRAYRELLPNQAEYETFYNFKTSDGKKNIRREAGFDLIRVIMREDRLKIFSTCKETIKQLKNYHVENGRVQERNDDFVDSLRYALISCEKRGKARNQVDKWNGFDQSNSFNPFNPYY